MGEEIIIAAYDPAWPAQFEAERALLAQVFGDLAVAIEHFGSTAVLGLPAKPIIDLMVGVRHIPIEPNLIAAVQALGYRYMGDFGIPGRAFFEKGVPRTHHLHVVEYGSEHWLEPLLFRDYLRAHPAEAARYAEMKKEMALVHHWERREYTSSKGPMVHELMEKARQWHNPL